VQYSTVKVQGSRGKVHKGYTRTKGLWLTFPSSSRACAARALCTPRWAVAAAAGVPLVCGGVAAAAGVPQVCLWCVPLVCTSGGVPLARPGVCVGVPSSSDAGARLVLTLVRHEHATLS